MQKVPVLEKTLGAVSQVTVVAGTNCPKVGDAGHGGPSILRLTVGADLLVAVENNPMQPATAVTLVLGGDDEAEPLAAALAFAAQAIKDQLRGKAPRPHRHEQVI